MKSWERFGFENENENNKTCLGFGVWGVGLVLFLLMYSIDRMPTIRVRYDVPQKQIVFERSNGPTVHLPTNTFQRFNINGSQNPLQDDGAFTAFQRRIRVLDMMKDGKTDTPSVSQELICDLQGMNPCPNFTELSVIKARIQEANASRISKTTWMHPNEITSKVTMLTTRKTYKESGINPHVIIQSPTYQSNIATEIIDPLGRTYLTPPELFPTVDDTLIFDHTFLTLFGLTNCSLKDKRNSANAHTYQIGVDGNSNHDITSPNSHHEDDASWNWFAGNKTKNVYIVNHLDEDDDNRTLLTIKEMGDVFQVLLMLTTKVVTGGLHTLVTNDETVFILCIQLGLDCVMYHHQPNAEHSIRHFTENYTIASARADWENARNRIMDHNLAVMNGVRHIQHFPKSHVIDVKTVTAMPGFNFCNAFYDDLLADMMKIQNALQLRSFTEGNLTDAQRINGVNGFIRDIKRQYTLNKLFTFKQSKSDADYSRAVSVNPATFRYTETPPPHVAYSLKGYKGVASSPFYYLYLTQYFKQKPSQCPHPSYAPLPMVKYTGGAGNEENGDNKEEEVLRVFQFDFAPVMYRVTENDPEFQGVPGEFDLHDIWRESVIQIFGDACGADVHLYKAYMDDLFWSLYEYCYANDVVLPAYSDGIQNHIGRFVKYIRILDKVYRDIELQIQQIYRRAPIRSVIASKSGNTSAKRALALALARAQPSHMRKSFPRMINKTRRRAMKQPASPKSKKLSYGNSLERSRVISASLHGGSKKTRKIKKTRKTRKQRKNGKK